MSVMDLPVSLGERVNVSNEPPMVPRRRDTYLPTMVPTIPTLVYMHPIHSRVHHAGYRAGCQSCRGGRAERGTGARADTLITEH